VTPLYDAFRLARPAFWALNDDQFGTVVSRTRRIPELQFTRPVRAPYLNKGVARHDVQVDQPQTVANLILDLGGA
jgi:hypothetical protein